MGAKGSKKNIPAKAPTKLTSKDVKFLTQQTGKFIYFFLRCKSKARIISDLKRSK